MNHLALFLPRPCSTPTYQPGSAALESASGAAERLRTYQAWDPGTLGSPGVGSGDMLFCNCRQTGGQTNRPLALVPSQHSVCQEEPALFWSRETGHKSLPICLAPALPIRPCCVSPAPPNVAAYFQRAHSSAPSRCFSWTPR